MTSFNLRVSQLLCKEEEEKKRKKNMNPKETKIKFDFTDDFVNFQINIHDLKKEYGNSLNTNRTLMNRFENEFSRKYHLREIAKYFDMFQKLKYKKYSNEYLSNLYDMLYYNCQNYAHKRNSLSIDKSLNKTNNNMITMKNVDNSINTDNRNLSSSNYNENLTKRDKSLSGNSSKTTKCSITKREMSAFINNKNSILKKFILDYHAHGNGNKREELTKYDMLTEELVEANRSNNIIDNDTKDIHHRINPINSINRYKCIKSDNSSLFKREELYKYYDDNIMNNYGKMFLNLSKKIVFYNTKNSNQSTKLKYMKERSENYENNLNKTLIQSYSQRKVNRIKLAHE